MKNYHKLYVECKSELDSHVSSFLTTKEDYICSAPLNNAMLRHDFNKVRRYKTGKFRIFYVLSSERPDLWETKPSTLEIYFLYFDLRKDETYIEALKFLRKNKLL